MAFTTMGARRKNNALVRLFRFENCCGYSRGWNACRSYRDSGDGYSRTRLVSRQEDDRGQQEQFDSMGSIDFTWMELAGMPPDLCSWDMHNP